MDAWTQMLEIVQIETSNNAESLIWIAANQAHTATERFCSQIGEELEQ